MVIKKNKFRPQEPRARTVASGSNPSARDHRARSRSHSIEPTGFPEDWAIDKSSLRTAINTFRKKTEAIRLRLQEPPSVGNTPTGKSHFPGTDIDVPPIQLGLPTPPNVSITPPGTPYVAASRNLPSSNRNSRAESAEEIIYEQPIGPMANLNDPVVQGLINDAVAEGILRFQRERRHGSGGPPGGPVDLLRMVRSI